MRTRIIRYPYTFVQKHHTTVSVSFFRTKDGQKFLMLLVTSAIVFVRKVRSVLHP